MPRTFSTTWSAGDNVQGTRLQAFNDELDQLYVYGSDRGRVRAAVSGLANKIDIGAFGWRVGQTHGAYNGAVDVSVTDNATNYIMHDATNAIVINTTGWIGANARLATVVTSGGVITAITMYRPDVFGGDLGGNSPLVADGTMSGNATLTTASDQIQFLDPNGSDRTVTLDTASGPVEGARFYIRHKGTANLLTVMQGSTPIAVMQPYASALFVFDGTDWRLQYQIVDGDDYGDGSDGDVVLSGNITLTRDMYYQSLDFNGFTINPASFKIYVNGEATGAGGIRYPGVTGGNGGGGGSDNGGGTGGTHGVAAAAPNASATLGPPVAGANGGGGQRGFSTGTAGTPAPSAGAAVTQSISSVTAVAGTRGGHGGYGATGNTGSATGLIGNGIAGGAAGSKTMLTSAEGSVHQRTTLERFRTDPHGANSTYLRGTAGTGGGGGGGGGGASQTSSSIGSGGGGGGGGASGGGGGPVWFKARKMSGSWTIEAIGGLGGNGGGGGGGIGFGGGGTNPGGGGGGGAPGSGGPGGTVVCICPDRHEWTGDVDVSGGQPGTPGQGGNGGGSDADAGETAPTGNVGADGVVFFIPA